MKKEYLSPKLTYKDESTTLTNMCSLIISWNKEWADDDSLNEDEITL